LPFLTQMSVKSDADRRLDESTMRSWIGFDR
jgi:hypothetical protein